MLTGLSVRDFVLVRGLDLDLGGGFSALTGETGAGKSILLSALAFAIGARAGQSLIRPGAEAASVTAVFDAGQDHPVRALLQREVSKSWGTSRWCSVASCVAAVPRALSSTTAR